MKKIFIKFIAILILSIPLMIGFSILIKGMKMLVGNFSQNSDDIISGEIIGVSLKKSSGRKNNNVLYSPKVEFTYQDKEYVITSSTSTSWNNYKIGDEIEVELNHQVPSNSTVVSSFSTWFPSIILILTSIFFIGIPGLIMFAIIYGSYIKYYLDKNGTEISLPVLRFEEKWNKKRERMYFYIISKYSNINTNESKELKSKKLKVDPSKYLKIGDKVKVIINPDNSNQYYFDLKK